MTHATRKLIETFAHKKNTPIAIIGLGKTGSDLVNTLLTAGFTNLTLSNRSQQKFEAFESKEGCHFIPFESRETLLTSCKVLVSAVESRDYVVTQSMVNPNQMDYQFFIDLGVPRSIDPAIGDQPANLLYTIEDIQDKNEAALAQRVKEIPRAKALIRLAVTCIEEFTSYHGFDHGQLIKAIREDWSMQVNQFLQDVEKRNHVTLVSRLRCPALEFTNIPSKDGIKQNGNRVA